MYRLWCHEILILETHSIYFNGINYSTKNQHQAILLHLLGGTGTVRSTTVTITAIQLKRSSASRSVNLQTNRTKTWQFKFTRNQGFTQDLNSEEMRRQWKAADNARTMRQTARRQRGRHQIPGKQSRRAIWPGTIQTRVFLRQGPLLALYKFCFQQFDKWQRGTFPAKPLIHT